jgi:hypothetical protein
MRPVRVISMAIAFAIASAMAFGQIPRNLSYQGVLTDTLGNPKPDGLYVFTFKLYAVATGGSALWMEAKSLDVKGGLFYTLLGDVTPFPSSFNFNGQYWLGIEPDAGPELSPRVQLASTGSSFYAEGADSARVAATIPDGVVTTDKLGDDAVTGAKIASAQVVRSVNTLKDDVTLAAGSNISITPSGSTLTIASVGGGSGDVSGTGLAGQISFWTGMSTIGGDSELFWDSTNKRLGVGTSSPNAPLHAQTVGGAAVQGIATAPTGSTYGGYFQSSSTSGHAVYGYSSAVTGNNDGGYFLSNSTQGFGVRAVAPYTGVRGDATGTTGVTFGGVFYSLSPSGAGVAGDALLNGVSGAANGTAGIGVYGTALATTGQTFGGEFTSSSSAGVGVRGVSLIRGVEGFATSTDGSTSYGGYFASSSNEGAGVFAQATSTTGRNYGGFFSSGSDSGNGVFGSAPSGGYAVYSNGSFRMTTGTFYATPTTTTWTPNKPATVKLNDGTEVKLFSEESAEIYFTDYGEGSLTNGRTHIELDPVFLQTVTVDAEHPMKVFVQLEADCNGVYVADKTTTGFDIVELHRGISDAAFTYRVVCKRKYYEDERLATEEEDIRYNNRMTEHMWPEVIAERKAAQARTETEETAHLKLLEAQDRNRQHMKMQEELKQLRRTLPSLAR